MRRLVVFLALMMTACNGNLVGPFSHRKPARVDDPLLTMSEQQARTRDRLALPDETTVNLTNVAPRTYTDRPGPNGI
ncbi:MAG: hypothetical protein ACK4RK_08685 [Gemmataceae bacterium]